MRNSLFVVLLGLAVLLGYALAPPRAVEAISASDTPAFSYGHTLLLSWQDGRAEQRCTVVRQAGDMLACGNQPVGTGNDSATVWYNLRFIQRVQEISSR